MKRELILAYDFGTSGVKIACVNIDGELFSIETESYSLITPQEGYAEQDPIEIWNAACQGTKRLLKNNPQLAADQIQGLAFGTQWKAIIPLNNDGEVLHNAIIWLDGRAQKQADFLNKKLNTDTFTPRDYHARLLWFKDNHPDLYAQSALIFELNGYLKFKATGQAATDISNDFIHSTNNELDTHYQQIVKAANLDSRKFPPLVTPDTLIGKITVSASEAMGIPAGIPVFGGFGDIPAIAVGSGCSDTGQAHIYLGSSGWLAISTQQRKENVGELYQSFHKNQEFLLYVMQSACMAQNWAIEQLYHKEKATLKDKIFEQLDNELGEIKDQKSNVLATPWLHGELPPLSNDARMCFINLSHHHDRRHMLQAIREGIGFSLRAKIQTYYKQTGEQLTSIRLVGGAASSELWMQTLANILQLPIAIPKHERHTGAMGVAYCAMVGLGVCKSFSESEQRISIKQTYQPDKKMMAHYDALFAVYQGLYPALQDSFEALSQLGIQDE